MVYRRRCRSTPFGRLRPPNRERCRRGRQTRSHQDEKRESCELHPALNGLDSLAVPPNARRHRVRSHQASAAARTVAMKAPVVACRPAIVGETVRPHPYIEDARGIIGFSKPHTVLKTAHLRSIIVCECPRKLKGQWSASADIRGRLPSSDRMAVNLAVRTWLGERTVPNRRDCPSSSRRLPRCPLELPHLRVRPCPPRATWFRESVPRPCPGL